MVDWFYNCYIATENSLHSNLWLEIENSDMCMMIWNFELHQWIIKTYLNIYQIMKWIHLKFHKTNCKFNCLSGNNFIVGIMERNVSFSDEVPQGKGVPVYEINHCLCKNKMRMRHSVLCQLSTCTNVSLGPCNL